MPPPAKKQKRSSEDVQNNDDTCVSWTNLPDELWLSILRLVTASTLVSVSRTCRSLRNLCQDPVLWTEIIIDWQSIKNHPQSTEQMVSRCSKLSHLTIRNRTFEQVRSNDIVSVIKKAKESLKHLVISPELTLANQSVANLGQMSSLTSLELAGDWIKTSGIAELANLQQLEKFKLPGAEQVTPKDLKDLFSKLTKLKLVDVSECKKGVTDMSVTALANNNPDLEYLALDECELITGKCLKVVADKCPHLNHISLDGCYQVNDPSMVKIASNCHKLCYVSISLCLVKDSTLVKLGAHCPDLAFLNLFGCSYLSERAIKKLVVSSDKLKHLDIRGILGVSQSYAVKLEEDHPNVQIVHHFQAKPPRDRSRRRN